MKFPNARTISMTFVNFLLFISDVLAVVTASTCGRVAARLSSRVMPARRAISLFSRRGILLSPSMKMSVSCSIATWASTPLRASISSGVGQTFSSMSQVSSSKALMSPVSSALDTSSGLRCTRRMAIPTVRPRLSSKTVIFSTLDGFLTERELSDESDVLELDRVAMANVLSNSEKLYCSMNVSSSTFLKIVPSMFLIGVQLSVGRGTLDTTATFFLAGRAVAPGAPGDLGGPGGPRPPGGGGGPLPPGGGGGGGPPRPPGGGGGGGPPPGGGGGPPPGGGGSGAAALPPGGGGGGGPPRPAGVGGGGGGGPPLVLGGAGTLRSDG
eukprot:comp22593_c0_seq1/m.34619 comp22593_c0_seq1/g.34619  ORF comp22593_c0_seq1/g.34619 comp22593_c0_seq1/m.34619 type:complete len:326 (+) comp22593_c0_seq1:1016-1993(+)